MVSRFIITVLLLLTHSLLFANVVQLNHGWNLIGSGAELNISTFSTANTVWKYKNGEWKVASPNGYYTTVIANAHYVTFDQIHKGEGFWVHINNDLNVTLDDDTSEQTINLQNGWNLLGSGRDLSLSTFSPANTVWRYKNNTWEVASPNGSYTTAITNAHYVTFNQIHKNEGFWVHINHDFNTTLDSNTAPVANAGVDQNIDTISTVTLNGSASSDINLDTLTFLWSITSKPAESNATLSNVTVVNPTFIADVNGSYVVQLIVNDGTMSSEADTVTIHATIANDTPSTIPDDTNNTSSDDDSNTTTTNTTTSPVTGGTYTLLAWNDLGMHCFDGSDFSVFSILPPYNNLDAHLIKKDGTSNKHITSGVTLTYEALSYNGHTNTKSSTKTNFWDYLISLFPGATSVADVGLTGNKAPSNTPQAMKFDSAKNWFYADGIPIINRDDNNATNYYPMVRVVAKDTAGATLATADVVLPVSDEMNCAKCHASTVTSTDAKPIAGWENDANSLKDYKLNILKLHDQKHPINSSDLAAAKVKGYNYQSSLYDTAKSGTPILCASCHSSNALGTTSIGNAQPLTTSLHHKHASVIDPSNGKTLNDSTNRDSCYSCHPGAATECLRGAMGSAKDVSGNQMMQCQSCHGTMNDVGNTNRTGWMDEPNCQVCHQNGQRYNSALVNGSMRTVLDTKFATNPNTPSAGVSLYRFSTGHGSLQCSSCHGSTHAIFPSTHAEDNVQSISVQGHSGTIAECTSCHTTMPSTTTGGPHGMHTVGNGWVSSHQGVAERGASACTTCHGADYRGSVLSKTFSARTLSVEHGTKTYAKGAMVSCYDCHNGPNGGD